jgi:predicted nucleotidyltransferase
MAGSITKRIVAGRVGAADIERALSGLVPETHRLVLFGSRATGRATARSDWDVGVVGPTPLDGALLERMREALDALPTLRRFDLVDLSAVAPALRERALREGVALGGH